MAASVEVSVQSLSHATRSRALRRLCMCMALVTPIVASAQEQGVPSPPARSRWQRLEPTLVAAAVIRPSALNLGIVSGTFDTGLAGEFGVRSRPLTLLCRAATGPFSRNVDRLAIDVHASLGATRFRGIEPRDGERGYSTTELGARAAFRFTDCCTPFVLLRRGKHAAELYEGGDIVNVWGSGSTRGLGLFVPRTKLGRGVTIAFLWHSGTFTDIETRDQIAKVKTIGTTSRPFTARSWQIGWSGPFTGVTWPWQ